MSGCCWLTRGEDKTDVDHSDVLVGNQTLIDQEVGVTEEQKLCEQKEQKVKEEEMEEDGQDCLCCCQEGTEGEENENKDQDGQVPVID